MAPRQTAESLLACYAERFAAVEMDSSFYRPPSAETIGNWVDATDDDFAWCVRMARDATHVDRLQSPETVARFLEPLAALGSRLGCVLFTTPPDMPCDTHVLRSVLRVVPPGVRTAWEFRHRSWLSPEVMDLLVEHGAAPVAVETLDGLSCPEVLPGGRIAEKWDLPFVYLRLRRERYHATDVLAWGRALVEALDRGSDVYAFFRQSSEAHVYALALDEILCEL